MLGEQKPHARWPERNPTSISIAFLEAVWQGATCDSQAFRISNVDNFFHQHGRSGIRPESGVHTGPLCTAATASAPRDRWEVERLNHSSSVTGCCFIHRVLGELLWFCYITMLNFAFLNGEQDTFHGEGLVLNYNSSYLILASLFKLITAQYVSCLICNPRVTAQRHMGVGGGEERARTIHKIQSAASRMHKTQPKSHKQWTCFQKPYTTINATSTIYRHSMEKLIHF